MCRISNVQYKTNFTTVCNRLNAYVRLPVQPGKLNHVRQQFYRIASFPNVTGCVDGTHIRIKTPTDHKPVFVNRKGYHSINAHIVCDADLKITNCVIKWPGSKHDSYVLRHSQFGEDFEALRLWYASGVAAPLRPVGATHPWGGSNYHENLGEWQLAGLWWPVKDIGYIYSIYIQYIQYIFWLYWIHMYGRGLGPHM